MVYRSNGLGLVQGAPRYPTGLSGIPGAYWMAAGASASPRVQTLISEFLQANHDRMGLHGLGCTRSGMGSITQITPGVYVDSVSGLNVVPYGNGTFISPNGTVLNPDGSTVSMLPGSSTLDDVGSAFKSIFGALPGVAATGFGIFNQITGRVPTPAPVQSGPSTTVLIGLGVLVVGGVFLATRPKRSAPSAPVASSAPAVRANRYRSRRHARPTRHARRSSAIVRTY